MAMKAVQSSIINNRSIFEKERYITGIPGRALI
jgi:hypothetical protein